MLQHYLPKSMAIMTWALQYEVALPPIDISGLRPAYNDPDDAVGICNPPHTHVPHGQPRKKRQDKASYRALRGVGTEDMLVDGQGEPEQRSVHCSTCRSIMPCFPTCRTVNRASLWLSSTIHQHILRPNPP